jgi:hypothetical protein
MMCSVKPAAQVTSARPDEDGSVGSWLNEFGVIGEAAY